MRSWNLGENCVGPKTGPAFVDEYHMKDGRKIYVLGDWRLVNGFGEDSRLGDGIRKFFATQAVIAGVLSSRPRGWNGVCASGARGT